VSALLLVLLLASAEPPSKTPVCSATYNGTTSQCRVLSARGLYSESCGAVFVDLRLAAYNSTSPHWRSTVQTAVFAWSRGGKVCSCAGARLGTRSYAAGELRAALPAVVSAKIGEIRELHPETGQPEPATFVALEQFKLTTSGEDAWTLYRPVLSAPALPAFSDQALCLEVNKAYPANASSYPLLPDGWEAPPPEWKCLAEAKP